MPMNCSTVSGLTGIEVISSFGTVKPPKKQTDDEKRLWSEGTIKIPDAKDKAKNEEASQ